jgi:hypothetical protein
LAVTGALIGVVALATLLTVGLPGAPGDRAAQSTAGATTDPPDAAGPPPADVLPWQGIDWAPVPVVGLRFEPGQGIRAMDSALGGLLAHGRVHDPRPGENPDGLTDTAAVWTSVDGRAWDVHPIVAGVARDSVSEVAAMAAGPRGIVVVGGVCCREERPAIWWSRDALTWERAPFEGLAATYFVDVAAGPEGFAAIANRDAEPQIWTSPDGLTWGRVDGEAAGIRPGQLNAIVGHGRGFVASGTDDPGIADADPAVWVSDGLDGWRRVAMDDAAFDGDDEASLGAMVPFAGGWFAVGGAGSRDDRLQCERLLGGEAMAALPATVDVTSADVALSCGWLRDMHWRTAGGPEGPWERRDPLGDDGEFPPDFVGPAPGFAPVSWDKVVAGGPGLIALQEELVRGWEDQTSWGVYVSDDGREWTRIDDGPDPAGRWIVGFAVDGRRLFALSESGDAWVGTVRP